MVRAWFLGISILVQVTALAQCPTVDFTIPASVCTGGSIPITNNTTGATGYKWDFCDGGLGATPTSLSVQTISETNTPWDVRGVKEGASFYLFIVSNATHSIVKLKYSSISGTPQITDLGSLGPSVFPQGIGLWEESGNKYALVTSNSGELYRLTFGSSYDNVPTVDNLAILSPYSDKREIQVLKDNQKIYAVTVGNNDKVLICDFGTSILNNSPVLSVVAVGGASNLTGVAVIKECASTKVLAAGNSGAYLLSFATGLADTPTVSAISGLTGTPQGVSLIKTKDNYIGFVAHFGGGLVKLNFGASITNTPTITNFGNFGSMTSVVGFGIFGDGTKYYGAAANYSDQKLTILEFPKSCTVYNSFDDIAVPSASYNQAGNFSITLTAYGANGEAASLTKDVTASEYASTLDFTRLNVCANNNVFFTSVNVPGDATTFAWDFGDTNTSAQQNPTKVYTSSGNFNVSFEVTGPNGCNKLIQKTLPIYNPPVASYSFPSSAAYCTNQQINFSNTSTIDPLSTPTWEWQLDGTPVSSTQNYSYTITSTTSFEVKLKASLQGCSSETATPFTNIGDGPIVDFTFTNGCVGSAIDFTNASTGSISGYSWDFDNGQTSTQTNSQTTYSSNGNFNVMLTAFNAQGCNNSNTKSITIYSNPQPDFSTVIPSFCSYISTKFNDNTPAMGDGNISSWNWDFGDAGNLDVSTSQNPQYAFSASGNYNVSLTVTTNHSCSNSIQKSVTVSLTSGANFVIPSAICREGVLPITNNTLGATGYKWDFCDGGLSATPTSLSTQIIAETATPWDVRGVKEGANFYLFIVSNATNSIVKLKYSNLAGTPQITDLGSLGLISVPQGISLWDESGNKFALVTSNSGALYRLSFGSSYDNTPTALTLSVFSGYNDIREIQIVEDNQKVYAVAIGQSDKVFICDFGTSILNSPALSVATVSGANNLTGVGVIKECASTKVLAAGNSGAYLLSFATGLADAPTVSAISGLSGTPQGVSLIKTKDNYIGFIAHFGGGLVKLDFGSSMTNTATITNFGTFGSMTSVVGFGIFGDGTKYYGAATNYSDNKLTILEFPKSCTVYNTFDDVAVPAVSFNETGNFSVTLTAFGANGEASSITKNISVSQYAPAMDFSKQNVCKGSNVLFTSANIPGDVVTFAWSFGDTNTSAQQNPAHIYNSANNFNVTLEITGPGGCKKSVQKTIAVYNPPVASFNSPNGSAFCTNQQLDFLNTSTTDPLSATSWEWSVNGMVASSSQNYSYTIPSTDAIEIKLKASLEGCSSETAAQFTNIGIGPFVDFTFVNSCAGGTVNFNNLSSGSILGYSWNFSNGQNSTDANPATIFNTKGDFDITLTALNTLGCNSSKKKTITVYSKPQPDFSIPLPPFSCNGTPTQFNDDTPGLTDSNVISWRWNFGDLGSTQDTAIVKSPEYNFAIGGNYNVSLAVATNYGCSATLVKSITIATAPSANFNYSPACENLPVTFRDTSVGNILTRNWQLGNTNFTYADPTYTFSIPGNYLVSLMVTDINKCLSYVEKTINVPYPVFPDFSVQKNCVGYPAEFKDITVGTDKVVSQNWTFANSGKGTGAVVSHIFTKADDFKVTLEVTTQAGCSYSDAQTINIVKAPKAYFTATPEIGAPPLNAQFINASENASAYLWSFNDKKNSISRESSTQFMFQDYGDYVVDLTATNVQNCSHTFSRIITVTNPVINISLTSFVTGNNPDGTISSVVTLKNQSNVSVQNLKLLLDVAGVQIKEVIPGLIQPNASITFVPQFSLLKNERLNYVCATIEVENEIDKSDNQLCASFENEVTFEPYPNPSADKLTVEWIADMSQETKIQIVDAMGHQEFMASYTSQIGHNQILLDLQSMSNGVYFLLFDSEDSHKKYRFAISR